MQDNEINEFLARELMGWDEFEDFWGRSNYPEPPEVICTKEDSSYGPGWNPCARIDQALGDGGPRTVVGEMRLRGWAFKLWAYAPFGKWTFEIVFADDAVMLVNRKIPKIQEFADIPSRSICIAATRALKAIK